MAEQKRLDYRQQHILTLIDRGADAEGWAEVSEILFSVLSTNIPPELVTFEKLDDGGRARFTEEGRAVFNAMAWL